MSSAIAPILAQFGSVFERLQWVPLGSGGGFSGSLLWKGDDVFALKAWPESMTGERLRQIHSWMKQASHLAFVPEVINTRSGASFVEIAGRVWDLTRWMPGVADFHANPSEIRLANACAALAEIHRAWSVPGEPSGVRCRVTHPAPYGARLARTIPAVQRRLSVLAEWKKAANRATSREAHGTDTSHGTYLSHGLDRAAVSVARLLEPAERALLPWLARPAAIQPCFCDVWHDHVLFTGDRVTGIIDYGAMKEDHVAVDLARLLGDLCEENESFFQLGLTAYRDAGGALDAPAELVRLLDRTGIVCAAIHWLLRILVDSRTFSDPRAVALRIARLNARMDAIHGF